MCKEVDSLMDKSELSSMSRDSKIKFLLSAQEAEPSYFNYSQYGDFSDITDEKLDELVEELDWIWK